MQETEFNLLEEPWVRVLGADGAVEEVSLTDALLKAHTYTDLAGETSAQDAAVLRLLLAVLHTVFARVDESGKPFPLVDEDNALGRWYALWQLGALPEKPILDYFEQWRDRFWLFHPERPFFQVPEAVIGTEYGAAKLNGEVLQSGNKLRLFSAYAGTGKTELTYAQAARWLVYTNGFDDTSAKPKKTSEEKLPSPGAGWLGKLGLVTLMGDNLFETLLLNLVLLQDGARLWNEDGRETPCWELDRPRSAQRKEISLPDNAAELLTLQSRRLLLCRERDRVIGCQLLGGDFFPKESAYAEQMTLWAPVREKNKNAAPRYQPRRHDPSRQIWQEFPAMLTEESNTGGGARQPGVLRWIAELRKCQYYQRNLTRCRTTATIYGDKDFFVNDAFSDTLTFHADLLTELGKKWQPYIAGEVSRCEETACQLGRLADELAISAGGDPGGSAEKARQAFYFAVDIPFRNWLKDIDPQRDDPEDVEDQGKIPQWREQAQRLARQQAEELVLRAGPAAFAGRMVKEKKGAGEESRHHSAPEAYRQFLGRLRGIYS